MLIAVLCVAAIPSKKRLYRTHHLNPFESDTDPEEDVYSTGQTLSKELDPFRDT